MYDNNKNKFAINSKLILLNLALSFIILLGAIVASTLSRKMVIIIIIGIIFIISLVTLVILYYTRTKLHNILEECIIKEIEPTFKSSYKNISLINLFKESKFKYSYGFESKLLTKEVAITSIIIDQTKSLYIEAKDLFSNELSLAILSDNNLNLVNEKKIEITDFPYNIYCNLDITDNFLDETLKESLINLSKSYSLNISIMNGSCGIIIKPFNNVNIYELDTSELRNHFKSLTTIAENILSLFFK